MNKERLSVICADPVLLAELKTCTSVRELVACLNKAGAECTREEALNLLRAWESLASDDEPMAETAPPAVKRGGVIALIRSFLAKDTAQQAGPARRTKPTALTLESLLARMNRTR